MGAADVVLTASGTASLEVLLTKRPMVVAYIISGITHRLVRWLGLKRLDYFSLPRGQGGCFIGALEMRWVYLSPSHDMVTLGHFT